MLSSNPCCLIRVNVRFDPELHLGWTLLHIYIRVSPGGELLYSMCLRRQASRTINFGMRYQDGIARNIEK
jgi:hypothetical protein